MRGGIFCFLIPMTALTFLQLFMLDLSVTSFILNMLSISVLITRKIFWSDYGDVRHLRRTQVDLDALDPSKTLVEAGS